MIDYDYETRLVDRIAAREAIASAKLKPIQRRVLCRYSRHGETYREISRREGVSVERIRQHHIGSLETLRGRLAEKPIAVVGLKRTTANTPPPDFDKAEFLRHMRGLIARREEQVREQRARDEEYARNWRKRERESLDRIMRNEESQGLFDPPPPLQPKLPPPPRPQPQWQPPSPPARQNVELWEFDRSRQPTLGDLRCIAQYALGYFVAARRPMHSGSSAIGKMTTRVVCPRTADAIATAMQRVRVEIPPAAKLSAGLLDVPEGLLAVTLGCPFVALRVASVGEGKQVSIEVTWDA